MRLDIMRMGVKSNDLVINNEVATDKSEPEPDEASR
jgi:hypothetical protein